MRKSIINKHAVIYYRFYYYVELFATLLCPQGLDLALSASQEQVACVGQMGIRDRDLGLPSFSIRNDVRRKSRLPCFKPDFCNRIVRFATAHPDLEAPWH